MGRRGRTSSPSHYSPMRSRAPVPVKTYSPVAKPAPQTTLSSPAPSQPGLLGQMAATAGGVAVGSAIGHTVGHAITGAFSSKEESGQVIPAETQMMENQQMQAPCQYEFKQFLNCTQEQADLSLCEGFNQIFKDCKMRYGSINM